MWTAPVRRRHLQSMEKPEKKGRRKPVLQRMRRHGAGRVGAAGQGKKSRKGQAKTAGESGDQTSDARGKGPVEETAEGGGNDEEERPEGPASVQGQEKVGSASAVGIALERSTGRGLGQQFFRHPAAAKSSDEDMSQ
ncbi:hypothetical protein MMC29_001151, partial [Sticta canariensis]|nr:hypothetical protein [Sticta canariensis]